MYVLCSNLRHYCSTVGGLLPFLIKKMAKWPLLAKKVRFISYVDGRRETIRQKMKLFKPNETECKIVTFKCCGTR